MRSRIPTPQQLDQIAEAMPDSLPLPVLCVAECGLRVGEAVALCRGDVRDCDGVMTLDVTRSSATTAGGDVLVAAKRCRGEAIRVPEEFAEDLRCLLAETEGPDSVPLFPGPDGARWRLVAFRVAYRSALSRAGVEQFSIHSLRQAFDG